MKTQAHEIKAVKKDYTSPRLVNYGAVRSLTQAGTMAGTENSGSMITLRPSDRMTKENIVRIGSHPFGIGLYLFDYKLEYCKQYGLGRQFGVMADEVETVMPEAVITHPDGYKMVNYAMLGIQHTLH